MTVRKVPKNQVPAALHDNQDAVTVSQDGDTVTVRQTGPIVATGYEGDDAIGTTATWPTIATEPFVVLDFNVGENESSIFSTPGNLLLCGDLPNDDVYNVYGLGEGHAVAALRTSNFPEGGGSAEVTVYVGSGREKTLTINFVPNE